MKINNVNNIKFGSAIKINAPLNVATKIFGNFDELKKVYKLPTETADVFEKATRSNDVSFHVAKNNSTIILTDTEWELGKMVEADAIDEYNRYSLTDLSTRAKNSKLDMITKKKAEEIEEIYLSSDEKVDLDVEWDKDNFEIKTIK
ncbi:MAG: hypothetical protein E7Z91_06305 [Cyanobacteria bacterium SIG30]|nr:hypothetical protein [Cyanobacteria bacterium SIG30]